VFIESEGGIVGMELIFSANLLLIGVERMEIQRNNLLESS
jgi:hypothetical protein